LTGRCDAAAFVHTAFWRDGADAAAQAYIGPVLDALTAALQGGHVQYIGLGPRRNFRARRWWDPFVGAARGSQRITPIEQFADLASLRGSRDLWRARGALAGEITRGDGIRQAAVFHGCDLWPVLGPELRDVALLQWPWSARAMDEAAAALDALAPGVAVTYAEAGGWGRALVLEARRRGIPTIGVQHGFIYRHWLNYVHEPDELSADDGDRGFPAPDRTLVFDRYAAEYLRDVGHLPAESIRITGSPTRDVLAAEIEASRQRGREAVPELLRARREGGLLVLAAKHAEIAPFLDGLAEALTRLPEATLVVKPHPAETPAVYATFAARSPRIIVAPANTSLGQLLASAAALVTMNSTVAIDCLGLGIPAIVLGLPNNLSPFVAAGVMLGGTDLQAALAAVLYDHRAREVLTRRAAEFAARNDMRATGQAAQRAAREILTFIS
jgi:hypothetical protein